MSSSARSRSKRPRKKRVMPYDWDVFTERPVPEAAEPLVSPASELGSLLQRYRADLGAAEAQNRTAAIEGRTTAIEQAVLVGHLERALEGLSSDLQDAGLTRGYKQLRVIKDQMLAALADGGITIEDPEGKAIHEVEDQVDVIDWRYGPHYTAEVVARTHEVIVFHQGSVVRIGQVEMGAPAPEGITE
jgi:hypothetical protein